MSSQSQHAGRKVINYDELFDSDGSDAQFAHGGFDILDSSIFTTDGDEEEIVSTKGVQDSTYELEDSSGHEKGLEVHEVPVGSVHEADDANHEPVPVASASADESGGGWLASDSDLTASDNSQPIDDADLVRDRRFWKAVRNGKRKLPSDMRQGMSGAKQRKFAARMLKHGRDRTFKPSRCKDDTSDSSSDEHPDDDEDDFDLEVPAYWLPTGPRRRPVRF